jgi:hypothetical protein
MKTRREIGMIIAISRKVGRARENASRVKGTLTKIATRIISQITAKRRSLWGRTLTIECVSDLQFNATASSKKINRMNYYKNLRKLKRLPIYIGKKASYLRI